MDFKSIIIDSTKEVFETMVFMDMEVDESAEIQEPVHGKITGMIGIAGDYAGVLTFLCSKDTAIDITANMLGMEPEEVDPVADMRDAIGEITNMVAGNVKMKVSESGDAFDLSIPTVIAGDNFSVGILTDAPCYIVPFKVSEQSVHVEMIIQKIA